MIQNRSLKQENLLLKNLLQYKIISFNNAITPGFKHNPVTRKDSPKEYFASLILHKMYSLVISVENSLFNNDVFLSIYLYRYVYELHVKVSYIFSGFSEEEIIFRLNQFFENKKWNLSEIVGKIDVNLISLKVFEDHGSKYQMICRFVHPNFESLKLHVGRTDDQQFEFMVPNINLTIWHSVAIIKLFSHFKLLDLHLKINQRTLELLQSAEI